MKRYWCRRCKEKFYRTRKDLRKHLQEEHLIKLNLRCFTDEKNRRHIQGWWGEEEW
jgi:hypothetical protein